MLENNDKYFEVLNDIKKTLIVTRNKIVENANKDLVLMYYNIGLKLIENNKWGSSFIDTLAKDLKVEFPTLKGMSARNLRYMQKFATEFDNDELFSNASISSATFFSRIYSAQRVWAFNEISLRFLMLRN